MGRGSRTTTTTAISAMLRSTLRRRETVRRAPAPDEAFAHLSDDGTKEFRNKEGVLHRDGDRPAVEYLDGGREWWQDGVLHREGAPAVVHADGSQEFYLYGKRHRDGGPAVLYADGSQEFFIGGALHREDGPASINADGTKEWWQDGLRHRVGGPAVTVPDGTVEYWYRGDRAQAPA